MVRRRDQSPGGAVQLAADPPAAGPQPPAGPQPAADLPAAEVAGAPRVPVRQHLLALFLYACLSLAMFGPWILGRISVSFLSGQPQDSSLFIWAFRWWPYALTHHLDPWITQVAWAPRGINIIWATAAPVPALVLAPVTSAFGPFAAFNVMELAAPPLAAWTAYLLCRRITASLPPALMGGFFFGFSPALIDEFGQGHPNLAFVCLVPLAAYLVVRLLEGSMSPRLFTAALAIVLAVQLYLGLEVFATAALAGGVCALAGFAAGRGDLRRRLRRAVLPVAVAYLLAGILGSPLLYPAFTGPRITKPRAYPTLGYGAQGAGDLLRYVDPGPYTVFWHQLGSRWSGYGNPWYLGVPLIVLLVAFGVTEWRNRRTWALAGGIAVILALSLGDSLRIFGWNVLPWRLFAALPVIKVAQPGRLVTYVYLLIAVLVTTWLARPSRRRLRWALAAAAALVIAPNVTGNVWTFRVPEPPLLATGAYRQVISPGETVWVVGHRYEQLTWQAETGFYFRLSGGFFGGVPTPPTGNLVVRDRLAKGKVLGVSLASIRDYLGTHRVGVVLVDEQPAALAKRVAAATGMPGVRTGGLIVFSLRGNPAAG